MVNRLNLHIDESGSQDFSEGRYIVAVVLHDHSANIADPIDRYECRLSIAGLPNIPFHGKICCMATKIMRWCRLGIGSDCLLNSLGSFVSFHFLAVWHF